MPKIASVRPLLVTDDGRVTIEGGPFGFPPHEAPRATVGGVPALVQFASPSRAVLRIPPGIGGGPAPVRFADIQGETAFVHVGELLATGLHQVDNPVIDAAGHVYLTYSGSRGQQTPVAIYRVTRGGPREIFCTGVTNPTSMAFDGRGRLYVSSRFDGTVSRVEADGTVDVIATDLGIACGLAFGSEGILYVGDRSGTIFRVEPGGTVATVATLPSSVAAFHLAVGPDGALYVTGPTLAPRDVVYRVSAEGAVSIVSTLFGRPQGVLFDHQGRLHVVEALAGVSGLCRVTDGGAELIVAGSSLVGAAFDQEGNLVVASNDCAWLFPAAALPA